MTKKKTIGNKEEDLVYLYVEDSPNRFWHNFWNIFWVCIVIWFIWAVYINEPSEATPEELEEFYLESYGTDNYPNEYFVLASNDDLPISYSLGYYCSDYMKSRIRDAFLIISEETDYVVIFEETIYDANIQIDCPLQTYDYETVYTAGEATLGVIGYSVNEATIDFYNLRTKDEVWEMGSCEEYPDTEIHEILHTFGFDHNDNYNSIMFGYSEGCYVDSIDDYIIECLKYTYTNGEIGSDCSYRSDVIGSLDEVEYEYEYEDCDYGWYDALNTDKFCCPEPNMYIDSDGYCSYY